eukprot:CAMPEP_0174898054 /NCGR_PEP_ID=MMETSP0167-20121228/19116_1 /TAXON_ID=38298 /ORGANISM="Rhodella maculata, Strain CCMP736" /LENGTH=128 /DNA_ID=CAMNT_0016138477 /DNA_START=105 /DNA_END=486 /DNA_ORIENTATION=+
MYISDMRLHILSTSCLEVAQLAGIRLLLPVDLQQMRSEMVPQFERRAAVVTRERLRLPVHRLDVALDVERPVQHAVAVRTDAFGGRDASGLGRLLEIVRSDRAMRGGGAVPEQSMRRGGLKAQKKHFR